MDKFDEKVIGYDSIKETLRQIADVLKRTEAYKEKGVSMPRGLLMESAPGLGKSLMASILMEESGRKSFVFRRINEGNTFLGEMKDIFDVAKEEAPSILLLEDLNLYVESNSPYAPEWACLQACIDETSDADIFVIATTNDTRYMPQSLLRPGRFDYILNLNPPLGKTAEDIVSYYLRDKNLAKDVQISDIVKAMPQVSCATLETVMNLAAINSVYRDHAHVQKEDIIDALLKVVYTFEEKFVSVPEQGGGKLIPDGMCNPGQIYTVSRGKSGMIGVFRLESQMLPGSGKFERTGLGSDRDCRESTNTAFNFLKANGNRISGGISTASKDYIINYQDLQGIGMTGKLALPTLIALCSIALGRPTVSTLAVLGEISISGTILKVDELANSLQVCLDSGAKKVLLPISSAVDLGTVPPELVGSFNLIFYSSAEDAVFKALGVE